MKPRRKLAHPGKRCRSLPFVRCSKSTMIENPPWPGPLIVIVVCYAARGSGKHPYEVAILYHSGDSQKID